MLICWTFLLAFFSQISRSCRSTIGMEASCIRHLSAVCPNSSLRAPTLVTWKADSLSPTYTLYFTFLNLISYNGQGLSPDGDIYQMVDYFSHIELLYERQLLPCCFRSLAIFHVPMEHVEMLSHFPAATEIHSSNPCRA